LLGSTSAFYPDICRLAFDWLSEWSHSVGAQQTKIYVLRTFSSFKLLKRYFWKFKISNFQSFFSWSWKP